ncbi:MAG TPA: sugar ABC transporter permease [Ktedonobacteraceae bacterium]|nr:sugar ABC transporter permease [Ktedonobacteraceae bacterium]
MNTPIASPAMTSAVSKGKIKSRWRRLFPTAADVFVLPYVLFLLAFGILPGLFALGLSFASFANGTPQYFAAGLQNYVTAFRDFRFGTAFVNVFQFLIISVPFGVIGVTAIALLLHVRTGWFSHAMRTIYFLPGAVAGPPVVLLTLFMCDPQVSPFRGLFSIFHMQQMIDVIQPDHLPLLFTLMGFFVGAGGWIAILYGGLQGISSDLLEAAKIDGANAWQTALLIKLPLIWRYVIYMFILTFAGNVQIFTEPQIVSANFSYIGISTISPTWSPNQLSYYFAFSLGNFGAAAALSLLMVAIGLIGATLIIRVTGFFSTDATAD